MLRQNVTKRNSKSKGQKIVFFFCLVFVVSFRCFLFMLGHLFLKRNNKPRFTRERRVMTYEGETKSPTFLHTTMIKETNILIL